MIKYEMAPHLREEIFQRELAEAKAAISKQHDELRSSKVRRELVELFAGHGLNVVKQAQEAYDFITGAPVAPPPAIRAPRHDIAKALGCAIDGRRLAEFLESLAAASDALGWLIEVVE